jgi:hypothetical protein
MSSADKTKLDGIASGAEVNVNADWNATTGDAAILNKPSTFPPSAHAASHTNGTDDIQSATASQKGLATATQITKLDGIAANANNYTHPNHSGEVTSSGDGATTIANDVVTNAKLANMATATIKGRATASTGDPEDLSASQVRTILNVADGATANTASTATPSALGTAAAGTATDFARADHVHSAEPSDSAFRVVGSSDATKKVAFEVDTLVDAATTRTLTVPNASGTIALTTLIGAPIELIIACSDEATSLTTGTAKVTFRAPYAFTLTAVRASVNTAPTGSTLIVDINEAGTTVLSTKLSIDASEKTSTTAASAAVISDSAIADDAEITIDIDQIGSTIAGKGLKVALIGTRA